MSQTLVVLDAGNAVVQLTFLTALLFTPVVSMFWPWWQHSIGRTVTAEAAAIALVLAPGVLHEWDVLTVTSIAFAWSRVVCLALVPGILIWRAIAIYLIQRGGSRAAIRKGSTR
jgi:hypothetical protein